MNTNAYIAAGFAAAFLLGVALGRWWGKRAMKSFFAGVMVDRSTELASLRMPLVAQRIRHLNLTFLGWAKANERLLINNSSGSADVALDQRQVTLFTGMLGASAKKLASAVDEALKDASWPALDEEDQAQHEAVSDE